VKCHQCGFDNRIDRLYCEQCGLALEHDLSDVQAHVDQEIRVESAKAPSRGVRWLLATGIVLAFVGYYFRGAYKELPDNDIVAFATAPTTPVDDQVTVTTDRFGVPLPPLKSIKPLVLPAKELLREEAIQQEAYRRAAVVLKHRGTKNSLQGLLLGDIVLDVPVEKGKPPVQVHLADIRSLAPTPNEEWDLRAVNLPKPVKIAIPNAKRLKFKLLEPQPTGEPKIHELPFTTIETIQPVE
jgi:hypothetical protein